MTRFVAILSLASVACAGAPALDDAGEGGGDARVDAMVDAADTAPVDASALQDAADTWDPTQGQTCARDEECDDGSFCDGVEQCVFGYCVASRNPACEDRIACTLDHCDEASHRCAFVPDDSRCSPGSRCSAVDGCTATDAGP